MVLNLFFMIMVNLIAYSMLQTINLQFFFIFSSSFSLRFFYQPFYYSLAVFFYFLPSFVIIIFVLLFSFIFLLLHCIPGILFKIDGHHIIYNIHSRYTFLPKNSILLIALKIDFSVFSIHVNHSSVISPNTYQQ